MKKRLVNVRRGGPAPRCPRRSEVGKKDGQTGIPCSNNAVLTLDPEATGAWQVPVSAKTHIQTHTTGGGGDCGLEHQIQLRNCENLRTSIPPTTFQGVAARSRTVVTGSCDPPPKTVWRSRMRSGGAQCGGLRHSVGHSVAGHGAGGTACAQVWRPKAQCGLGACVARTTAPINTTVCGLRLSHQNHALPPSPPL